MKPDGSGITWLKDETAPGRRRWEEFYRNRWQHDRVVRSTHGVNCTGGCSWQIYVKNGIVTWEMQGLDYPEISAELPPYEPRGCQRGISCSWYLYSPLRVKYPYVRGVLLDLWTAARERHADPVEAWRRSSRTPRHARDGSAPGQGRPAPRQLGHAARAHRRRDDPHDQGTRARSHRRLLADPCDVDGQLCVGRTVPAAHRRRVDVVLRLVLRPAERLTRDVGGADRRPRVGRLVQREDDRRRRLQRQRHADARRALREPRPGTTARSMWVFSPDFSRWRKFADEWVGLNAGQDGAWWMAVNRLLLKEFHHERRCRTSSTTAAGTATRRFWWS
jgi:nitrate reductase / nitrite oxidoreductase, alpha subunit